MKQFARKFSTALLVVALIVSCASAVYSEESSEKAKNILEKTVKKYGDMFKEDAEGVKSIAAKISIKGGTQVPMGDSGSMPMDINAGIEVYVSRPNNLYLAISGNLGNANIVVSGDEAVTATLILPTTMQFATMDVPEDVVKTAKKEETEEEPFDMEDLWKDAVVTYEGTEKVTAGKAHKIKIKSNDPADKGSVNVYILDNKWDPARLEINDEEGGTIVVDFEKLEVNAKIPDSKFVPNTEGYTEVSQKDITTVIMMQVMGAMMQQQSSGQ